MKKGHWVVTPPTPEVHRFKTVKSMIKFLRKHPGCLVTWAKKDHQIVIDEILREERKK